MPNRSSKPRVEVTAFGKHPAWEDHIGDLPLPGPDLAPFKRALYDRGIQVAMTKWTRTGDAHADRVLDAGEAIPGAGILPLDHHACWINAGALVLARLGPSRDRAGRAKFPLVVAAQFRNIAPSDAAGALEDLDATFERCEGAPTHDAVRAALAQAEDAIEQRLSTSGTTGAVEDGWRGMLVERLDDPLVESARALHHQRAQAEAARNHKERATHLRAPALDLPLPAGVEVWTRLLGSSIQMPVLALSPRGRAWLDLFGAAGGPIDLERIRSTRERVATTIDYEIGTRLAKEVRRTLRLAPAGSGTSGSSSRRRCSGGQRLDVILGVMLALLGLAVLAAIIFVAIWGF